MTKARMQPEKRLIISFQHDDVNQPAPWPVGVSSDGTVTSGLGHDDGSKLIGFGERGTFSIKVWPGDAVDDPSSVVGLVPTFSNGSFFEWTLPVSELGVFDA